MIFTTPNIHKWLFHWSVFQLPDLSTFLQTFFLYNARLSKTIFKHRKLWVHVQSQNFRPNCVSNTRHALFWMILTTSVKMLFRHLRQVSVSTTRTTWLCRQIKREQFKSNLKLIRINLAHHIYTCVFPIYVYFIVVHFLTDFLAN